jgi:glycosyltransferase involved in cell wall biosynthesis
VSTLIPLHVDGVIFAARRSGGIRRVFASLLRALGERQDVAICVYAPAGTVLPPELAKSVDKIDYPQPAPLRPQRYLARLNARREMRATERMWAAVSTGVFHSTYYSTSPALEVPQVLTVQDTIYETLPECFAVDRASRHVEQKRRCVAAAAAVVFSSESGRNEAMSLYPIAGKLTAVVRYAVESVFQPRPDRTAAEDFARRHTQGHPFLLYVGDRWAHKNFLGLLEAFVTWKGSRDFHLLAVGGGEPTDQERTALRELGADARVHFASVLPEDELISAYNATQAVVVPALKEGFGLPLLEALACGAPVASSRGGALTEIGGAAPVYFDPKSADDITTALESVVALDRASPRVQEGVRRARQRTWANVAEEYLAVYRLLS